MISSHSQQLEEEVARLKQQLEQAESSTAEARQQLQLQKTCTQQLVQAWRLRLEEAEAASTQLRQQKDAEMRSITSSLLFFEGQLRKEQKQISGMLAEKDEYIRQQKETIRRLQKENAALKEIVESANTSPENPADEATNETRNLSSAEIRRRIHRNRRSKSNVEISLRDADGLTSSSKERNLALRAGRRRVHRSRSMTEKRLPLVWEECEGDVAHDKNSDEEKAETSSEPSQKGEHNLTSCKNYNADPAAPDETLPGAKVQSDEGDRTLGVHNVLRRLPRQKDHVDDLAFCGGITGDLMNYNESSSISSTETTTLSKQPTHKLEYFRIRELNDISLYKSSFSSSRSSSRCSPESVYSSNSSLSSPGTSLSDEYELAEVPEDILPDTDVNDDEDVFVSSASNYDGTNSENISSVASQCSALKEKLLIRDQSEISKSTPNVFTNISDFIEQALNKDVQHLTKNHSRIHTGKHSSESRGHRPLSPPVFLHEDLVSHKTFNRPKDVKKKQKVRSRTVSLPDVRLPDIAESCVSAENEENGKCEISYTF